MKRNAARLFLLAVASFACTAAAEETGNTAPARHITLQEAVQLAFKHNHGRGKRAREAGRKEFLFSIDTK